MFLAQLKMGMELVKAGGFLLYVLPHSFLIADNASKLRETIASDFHVRFVADLSDIPVFGSVGAYVLLLVLQKKPLAPTELPKATIVRCLDYPGQALQDALDGRRFASEFYQIFDADQVIFKEARWQLLHPSETSLKTRLQRLPTLDKFLTVREGFVTGADDVFIRRTKDIPKEELAVYAPFLPDRAMERYATPKATGQSVFYPFIGDEKVTGDYVRQHFPETWKHLRENSQQLTKRKAVLAGKLAWWLPERPRSPANMIRPKLVSPHLILVPRFSLDEQGGYAVSHSPLMYPTNPGDELSLLRFFLAVLNSSIGHWQIANLSHKYSRGYAMLETKTLNKIRVPDPASVPPTQMKRIQQLVGRLQDDNAWSKGEAELDVLVASLYGFSQAERDEIGMG